MYSPCIVFTTTDVVNNFEFSGSESIGGEKTYEEKFSEFGDDVDGAFLYLLNKLEVLWSETDYRGLQKICVRDTRLSESLRKSINNAHTLEKTFDLLKSSPYFTWFEIRILRRMATVADITEAKCLIKCYENYAFTKPCSAVQPYFYKHYIIPDHLTKVTAKLNVNPEKVTVSDLIKYCLQLDGIAGLPAGSSTLIEKKEGCLEFSAVIPTYYSFHAFNKAKGILLKLRPLHMYYHQVGSFPQIYTVDLSNTEEANILLNNLSSTAKHCKLYIEIYCTVCMHVN